MTSVPTNRRVPTAVATLSAAAVFGAAMLAGAAACGKTVSHGTTDIATATPTATAAGEIISVDLQTATLQGRAVGGGERIFANQDVATDASGRVTFRTGKIDLCNLFEDTDVTVRPSSQVLLRYNGAQGMAICKTKNTGQDVHLQIGSQVEITMQDPVWTVAMTPQGDTIRVAAGSLTVSAAGSTQQVDAGAQIIVPNNGPPGPTGPFALDGLAPNEQQVLKELTGIVGIGRAVVFSPKPGETVSVEPKCEPGPCARLLLNAVASYADGTGVPDDHMRWVVTSDGVPAAALFGTKAEATLAFPTGSCSPQQYDITLQVLDRRAEAIVDAQRTVQVSVTNPPC